MPGTTILDFQTPDRAPPPTLDIMRPPPENIPLNRIRLNGAGNSQRNAKGIKTGRWDVLQHKPAHATARGFRPPGYLTALRPLMFSRRIAATRREEHAARVKGHLATGFQK